MWVLLVVAFLALPLLSAPGKYVFDTRDPLWFNPSAYLARALALWRATPYLGQEQHDGILVPMAIGVWLLRSVGISVWVAERLWHGALLFTTTATTIVFVDGLRGRRTIIAPLTAGLAYTLTPYVIGYGLPFTPVFLPYVLLPMLLLVAYRGAGRPGLLWPALFGLVTFLMGGGNGAPQVYVLVAAMTLVAWRVFAERAATIRQGITFALCSSAFFIGLNAYWLFLLSSPEVFNALKFSEQPIVINVTSSASEALRGLGYWAFYGGDQFGPWITTVRPYITSPLLILTGFAVPLGALISAWLVRWSHRLYFVLLAVAAVFISMGIFPVHSPSPFGRALQFSYAHVIGVVGLRTTYKVTAEVNLAVAVLAGVGLEALWVRTRGVRRSVLLRTAVLGIVLAVIGANGYPLWTGRLYNQARGASGLPTYWQQALHELDQRDTRYRAFFAPATYWTTYSWGSIKESVVATDPRLNAVYPLRLPIAQRYGSNLVAAIEEPYLDGAPVIGTAQLLRYLGVRDVVLQNDVNWQRSHTARPSELHLLLQDPSLQPIMDFGVPGENIDSQLGPPAAGALERTLHPVEVLSVRDAVPMIRAEGPTPIVVSGDGFGIANAARQGLLPEGAPLLYSGTLTPAGLQGLLQQSRPTFLVTDTNRREVWYFSGPRSPHSYTLPPGETIGGRPIGYLLFNDRTATQSVAVYPGLRAITSSGYGAVFGTSAQYRPANAFDDDPSTWWVVGNGTAPLGAWIQATLASPMRLSSISIAQPDVWWLREIRAIRLTFSDGSTVVGRLERGRKVTISFPPRLTSSVRLTILQAAGNPVAGRLAGSALSDVEIPGLHPAESIRVPTDLFDAASDTPHGIDQLAGLPFTYLFQRARNYYPGGPDEEVRIARRFEVAGTRTFALEGTVHLNRTAADEELDGVLLGDRGVTVVSSSRLFGNPVFRGSAAFDGNPTTEWASSAAQSQSLAIRFPPHRIDHIVVDTDTSPGRGFIARIRAVFADGTSVTGSPTDPSTGVISLRFPKRMASAVTLFVDKVLSSSGGQPGPFGITEVHIPGVSPVHADASAPLPCTGSVLNVDGQTVPVRPIGTVGDLLAGDELPLATCDGAPISLSPGWNTLVAGGGLQPDAIVLSSGGDQRAPTGDSLPTITESQGWGGEYDVQVQGAQGPYYLVTGQNFDPHWQASIAGRDLGPPLLLDGYAAGWRIDRAGSYKISVRYGKQSVYTFALGLTAAALVVALGAVAMGIAKGRRSSGASRRVLHRWH